MKISVELTLSPLQNDFEPIIIKFIKKLRASGLTVLENPLSTQVYGDYETTHIRNKRSFPSYGNRFAAHENCKNR